MRSRLALLENTLNKLAKVENEMQSFGVNKHSEDYSILLKAFDRVTQIIFAKKLQVFHFNNTSVFAPIRISNVDIDDYSYLRHV